MKKSVFKTLLTSAVILSSVAAPAAAFAQDFDAQIGAADEMVGNLTSQQAILYAQLAATYAQISEVNNKAVTLQADIQATEDDITSLEQDIQALEASIAERQVLLDEQARAVQASGGTTNYVNVVASAKSVSDFVGRADVVKKLVNANKKLLDEQVADKEAVESKKADVEAAKNAMIEQQFELESLKADLEAANAENQAIYDQLTTDINLAAANRDALIAEKQAYEQAQALAAQQAAQAAVEAQQAAQAVVESTPAPESSQVSETEVVATEVVKSEVSETSVEVAPVEALAVSEVSEVSTEADATQAEELIAPESTEEVATTQVVESVVESTQATEIDTTQAVETTAIVETTVEDTTQAPETTTVVETTVEETTIEETTVAETTQAPAANNGDVVAVAAQYLGTPYVWGGRAPGGFDCSGFVQYVFRQAYGIEVGSWTVPQESSGDIIPIEEAQPGDLYFWGSRGASYHVAIATGGGSYINAPQTGDVVKYGSISNYYPSFAVRVRR